MLAKLEQVLARSRRVAPVFLSTRSFDTWAIRSFCSSSVTNKRFWSRTAAREDVRNRL